MIVDIERRTNILPIVQMERPRVRGKFFFAGNEKFYPRGVTYGTFRTSQDGYQFPGLATVEQDFAQMAAHDLNAVRVYTVPPRWLLDAAQRHGLRVMVGIPWEQHIAFLDDEDRAREIEARVRAGVRACAGHPAILCYAIGNEIPAPIVRWYGRRQVERFLKRLYTVAKAEDPGGLVTYVNYPSTEFLRLPFLDFGSFNVYLESQERLEAYLARLHTLTGDDRPLVMAEIGLDSRRNGEDAQAQTLDWQLRTAFAAGCAGTFVFAWTDEWHRGGYDVNDWDFGLTRRDRQPKSALSAVRRAFNEASYPAGASSARISVVVCTYNGAGLLRKCLDGLQRQAYPDYEVIVVNDGSTDRTAEIAAEYDVRLISMENSGLSTARNVGLAAAIGEIVAYIDDDACADPHWLSYLGATLASTGHAGVGGPNLAPPGDGPIADCVANAPGGPLHVLLSDREAEHIPGCNMAFRRSCLAAIGGFDPRFHAAGDDVDICWRLQQQGWTLGFNPAAIVWHHRRNSLRAYWKQQLGYGRAEALLERKWPEKYNAAGHLTWSGRLYGKGSTQMYGWPRERIYGGTWGSALFQSVYGPESGSVWRLFLMPEWYLIVGALAALSAIGLLWTPLLLALPLLVVAFGGSVALAVICAMRASFTSEPRTRLHHLKLYLLTVFLHLLQPLARLSGRLRHGLTPWRHRGVLTLSWPRPWLATIWSERWQAPDMWLRSIESVLKMHGAVVRRGGDFDRWDLEVRGGLLGQVRARTVVEEHGAGKQFLRFRSWPRYSRVGLAITVLLLAFSIGAALDSSWPAAALLLMIATLLGLRAVWESASATATIMHVFGDEEIGERP